MARGDQLPIDDQVTRGCSRGVEGDEITASAFAMRSSEIELLRISVDWVECAHAPEIERNLEGSQNRMRENLVKPPYAVLKVAEIRQVESSQISLDIVEFGNAKNPCHCVITGFSNSHVDLMLQQELAKIANRSPIIKAAE